MIYYTKKVHYKIKDYLIDFDGGNFWQEPSDSDLYIIKFTLTDLGMENAS